MRPDRERRILEIAERVLELPHGDRETVLTTECAEDVELRTAVERVLATDARDDTELEPPSGDEVQGLLGHRPKRLSPGERIGSHVVEGVIAEGGMGVIYAAVQDRPHRKVAIKVLTTGFTSSYARRRFAYEVEALGQLTHPAIAHIHDAGTHEDADGQHVPYLVMEYVEGARSIVDFAVAERLGWEERLRLFTDVCDAVEHGHRRKVIHRDLKPGNILVDAAGRVKIIDYGIARGADADPGRTTFAIEQGQIVGTLGYISPEQLDGDPMDVDTRSDVYSLGIVLHELLCERLVHELDGLTLYEAGRAVREAEAPRPTDAVPGLPAALDRIVAGALARSPDERTPSAAALASQLRDVLVNPSQGTAGSSAGGRRWWPWIVVAVLAAGAAWLLFDRMTLADELSRLRSESEGGAPAGDGD